jgi:hypothetical protein
MLPTPQMEQGQSSTHQMEQGQGPVPQMEQGQGQDQGERPQRVRKRNQFYDDPIVLPNR